MEIVRERGMDAVKATVELKPEIGVDQHEAERRHVERSLKGALGIEVEVALAPYGSLPRAEFKAKRLFDRR